MARRTNRQNTRKAASSEPLQESVPQSSFFWDWILSLLLLVSAATAGPFQTVRVLPLPTEAALAPDWAWDPPLADISAVQTLAEWPFWIYAPLMSFLIVSILSKRLAATDARIRLALLVAISLRAQPIDLMAAAIVAGVLGLPPRTRVSLRSLAPLVLAGSLTLLLCLDFSLVLLVLATCVLSLFGSSLTNRQAIVGAVAFLAALTIPSLVWRGFAAAAMRPLTWQTVPESVLPMSHAGENSLHLWLPCLLAVGVVALAWWNAWRSGNSSVLRLVLLGIFSVLSLTSHHYQFLSLLGIVCLPASFPISSSRPLKEVRLRWSIVLVAVLYLLPQVQSYQSFVLTGRWPRQSVDPSTFGTSGRVLLMKPQDAVHWRTGRTSQLFDPIIDDRWDLFRGRYESYLQVCRDLRDVRSSRYLRSDGEWGGYKQWTEKWKPALLVADSTELDGIRKLSLSPHWKVLGIDSHRTIFGAAGVSENQNQIRTAGRLLSQLEWPGPGFDGSFGNVLAATGGARRTGVAEVLLSMRLPYAALRVMPESASGNKALTARCHFELAHRVYRHTRTHSLLDQYRAVYQLRRLAETGELSAQQVVRVARGLEEIDELGTARDFAEVLTRQQKSAEADELKSAEEVISRCEHRSQNDAAARSSDSHEQIRAALRSGDPAAVAEAIGRLGEGEREFFQVLANSVSRSAEDLYFELISLLNGPKFPTELRCEALFYLGSLAVEVGDSESAAQAFSASIQADPAHPLNSISRLSLMNLHQPAG